MVLSFLFSPLLYCGLVDKDYVVLWLPMDWCMLVLWNVEFSWNVGRFLMHAKCLTNCPFHELGDFLAHISTHHSRPTSSSYLSTFCAILSYQSLDVTIRTCHKRLGLPSWHHVACVLTPHHFHHNTTSLCLNVVSLTSWHHVTMCLAVKFSLSDLVYVTVHFCFILRAFHHYCMNFASFHIHSCISYFRWSTMALVSWFLLLITCTCPKRARTSTQPSSGSTSYSRSKFISFTAHEIFGSEFSLCLVLIEWVNSFWLSSDLAAIFTSWGWEPSLMELSPPPSLLV